MEATLVSTVQIWDKGKSMIILFVIAALIGYINIHNRIAVLVGSFMTLVFTLYIKKLAASLEYQSFRIQLTLLSSFATTGASILLISVFGRVFSDFIAESGVISISTLHMLIVILVVLITIYGILPPYLWLYNIPLSSE